MFPLGKIYVINTTKVLTQFGYTRGLHTSQQPSDSKVKVDIACIKRRSTREI